MGTVIGVAALWGAILSTVVFWIQMRSKRSRLRVTAQHMRVIPSTGKEPEFILVEITNVGEVDVLVRDLWLIRTMTPLLWRISRRFRRHDYVCDRSRFGTLSLPKKLKPSEQHSLRLSPAKDLLQQLEEDSTPYGKTRFAVKDSMGRWHTTSSLDKCFRRVEPEREIDEQKAQDT